jgi:hypothetical protein
MYDDSRIDRTEAPDLARPDEVAEREAAPAAGDRTMQPARPEPRPQREQAPRPNGGTRPESMTITQGGVQSASADSISVRQGGIVRADAQDIAITMGGIALGRADRISVELGGMGAAIGREVHLTQGGAQLVLGRDVAVHQSFVQSVAAGSVRFDRPSIVVFLLARRVDGSVRTLFDWRSAIVFGSVAGLVMSVFRRRR